MVSSLTRVIVLLTAVAGLWHEINTTSLMLYCLLLFDYEFNGSYSSAGNPLKTTVISEDVAEKLIAKTGGSTFGTTQ